MASSRKSRPNPKPAPWMGYVVMRWSSQGVSGPTGPVPAWGLERPVDWGMSLLGAATLTLSGLLFSTALPFRGRLLIGATLVLATLALGGSLLGTARGVSPVATAASCM